MQKYAIGPIFDLENPRERPLTPLQSGMRALYFLQKGQKISKKKTNFPKLEDVTLHCHGPMSNKEVIWPNQCIAMKLPNDPL